MIRTLAWKELREHQGIWITMVFMSIVLGLGLSRLVALGDANIALPVAAFTILGMAATYGVVCGAMMFAGEHEGGTLTFLDIFHGRRGRLWTGKFAIGCVLALTQAIAVATLLGFLQPESPKWVSALVGRHVELGAGGVVANEPSIWFMVLPVVTLEAFFWGLLGSSLSQKVLAGAAVAAAIFTPVLLIAILAPPGVFVVVRMLAIVICLAVSFSLFVNQSQDGASSPRPEPQTVRLNERKEAFLDKWEQLERDEEPAGYYTEPVSVADAREEQEAQERRAKRKRARSTSDDAPRPASLNLPDQPGSPSEAMWWLTWQQAHPIVWSLLIGASFLGLVFIPLNFQVLWPIASLLLGVACGVAAFAPEQRDLSYQHLAAQHLPLRQIWRFKILFWLSAAVLIAVPMLIGTIVVTVVSGNQERISGTFVGLMRPTLFLGVWLLYGFATGQVFVWLCRKSILALLISVFVAIAAVGLWFPSLMCGGMWGWQMLVPPMAMLIATCVLMRAWAGGRLWERKPMLALCGYGGAILVWALVVFGFRAVEVPNVGEPLDQAAFRESLPKLKDNDAAKEIQKAVGEVSDVNGPWYTTLEKAAQLPLGVIDIPRADGQSPVVTHLPACRRMGDGILALAARIDRGPALEQMAIVLMLSRTLRNKAATESYLVGIDLEMKTMNELDNWLKRNGKPEPAQLRRVLTVLNKHADETPPLFDCVRSECFRSSGVVANPALWSMSAPGRDGRIPELWLANGIAVSLEAPWEAERRTRLWQVVWSGLLRHARTPHWELPVEAQDLRANKGATSKIMESWLADPERGPGHGRVVRLLDSSWLADTQLFPSFKRVRDAATRAQWRVDSMRLSVALSLYQMEHGKAAPDLNALVPNYLPTLPTDVYSGKAYQYRIEPNGDAIVWSTGPDRVDHHGLRNGFNIPDDDAAWQRGDFDLIVSVPRW